MSQPLHRRIDTPLRSALNRDDLWEAHDKGLIKCWEVGRQRASRFPDLAKQCLAGELPVLGWKGGVNRSLKKLEKYGSLKYLAQWQGLRGEDLDVDLCDERALTCSRTSMVVTFTPERTKYFNQVTQEQA